MGSAKTLFQSVSTDALQERRRRALALVAKPTDGAASALVAPPFPVNRPPRALTSASSAPAKRSPSTLLPPLSIAEILGDHQKKDPVLAGAAISGGDLVIARVAVRDRRPTLVAPAARFVLPGREQEDLVAFAGEVRRFLMVSDTTNVIQASAPVRGPFRANGLASKIEAVVQLSAGMRVRSVPTPRLSKWIDEHPAWLPDADMTGFPRSKALRAQVQKAIGAAVWTFRMSGLLSFA